MGGCNGCVGITQQCAGQQWFCSMLHDCLVGTSWDELLSCVLQDGQMSHTVSSTTVAVLQAVADMCQYEYPLGSVSASQSGE